MVSREGPYKTRLKHRIEDMFPGCVIVKADSSDLQGIPDLLILFGDRWAALEVKISLRARTQPNQPYWVDRLGEMSFAAFICPEIEDEVLHELAKAFGSRRRSRVAQP
jgi:hypothetical protein